MLHSPINITPQLLHKGHLPATTFFLCSQGGHCGQEENKTQLQKYINNANKSMLQQDISDEKKLKMYLTNQAEISLLHFKNICETTYWL